MIPYKLAKKLKDAGFPSCREAYSFDSKETLPDPTLSELIEACGKDVGELMQSRDCSYWVVNDMKGKVSIKAEFPDEAVAKLWLKLNKPR